MRKATTRSKRRAASALSTKTDAVLESISDGVFTIDLNWRIRTFNRAAEEITGISRLDAIGRLCSEVFRCSLCESECALRKTLRTGKAIVGRSGYIVDSEGAAVPISVSTAVLRDSAGRVVGGAETFRDLSEVEALRQELEGRRRIGDLVSASPLMQRVFDALPAIAASPSTVLILGETGTGKEMIARTIHSLSTRSASPFLAVNCAALPETLLEAELFGYKAGAFTGAHKDKPGRFGLAKGGTLLLDEIGEVSPSVQIRLLRVLQERSYEPLGGTRSETTDARIIVATNRDLAERVRAGAFREDLYYRVNVVRVELPPLRQRKEDIPLLVDEFIVRFNRIQRRAVRGISLEAISLLMAHDWPGNVRELENAVERAFVVCGDGPIDIRHLPTELISRGGAAAASSSDIRAAHDSLDVRAIQAALDRHGQNRAAAALDLGIHRSTLHRKAKRLGLPLPERDGRSQTPP